MMRSTCAYSVTFCDRAENHAGMQMIGSLANRGFSVEELEQASERAKLRGLMATVHDLNALLPDKVCLPDNALAVTPYEARWTLRLATCVTWQAEAPSAAVLVIEGAATALLKGHEPNGSVTCLLAEMGAAPYDNQALMGRGAGRKVKNKHARHNHCIADFGQLPNISASRGTVVPFSSLPAIQALRTELPTLFGAKAHGLVAETNKYFDVRQCGIGWHGDAERRLVVGLRLGEATASMPLKFQWFQRSKPVGMVLEVVLKHGDMYAMSEKAVGCDWMTDRKGLTLRHAAGADKYAKNKEPLSGVKRARAEPEQGGRSDVKPRLGDIVVGGEEERQELMSSP